jgi:hypothetical protein
MIICLRTSPGTLQGIRGPCHRSPTGTRKCATW